MEKDRSLASLDIDVGINRGNNQFETLVLRESTFSGVYANYRLFIASIKVV